MISFHKKSNHHTTLPRVVTSTPLASETPNRTDHSLDKNSSKTNHNSNRSSSRDLKDIDVTTVPAPPANENHRKTASSRTSGRSKRKIMGPSTMDDLMKFMGGLRRETVDPESNGASFEDGKPLTSDHRIDKTFDPSVGDLQESSGKTDVDGQLESLRETAKLAEATIDSLMIGLSSKIRG